MPTIPAGCARYRVWVDFGAYKQANADWRNTAVAVWYGDDFEEAVAIVRRYEAEPTAMEVQILEFHPRANKSTEGEWYQAKQPPDPRLQTGRRCPGCGKAGLQPWEERCLTCGPAPRVACPWPHDEHGCNPPHGERHCAIGSAYAPGGSVRGAFHAGDRVDCSACGSPKIEIGANGMLIEHYRNRGSNSTETCKPDRLFFVPAVVAQVAQTDVVEQIASWLETEAIKTSWQYIADCVRQGRWKPRTP